MVRSVILLSGILLSGILLSGTGINQFAADLKLRGERYARGVGVLIALLLLFNLSAMGAEAGVDQGQIPMREAPGLVAQDPGDQGTPSNSTSVTPLWTPFSTSDGLISNNVTSILADDTVIWFGTDVGVSRFDGLWTSYASGLDLPPGKVTVLTKLTDPDALWMGTELGALARWNGQSWQPMGEVGSSVNALARIDGVIWLGTDAGIFALVPSGDEADQMAVTPIDDFLTLPEELNNVSVRALASSGEQVFVGTTTGLWSHNGDWTLVDEADGLPSSAITAIWISPIGSIWVGTEGGVARWDPDTLMWTDYPTKDFNGDPLSVGSLQGDSLGVVWGGSASGVYQFNKDGTALQLPGGVGLTTAFVQALALDADGYVWVGTVAGIFRYDRDLWLYERRTDFLPEEDGTTTFYIGINEINDLLVDSRNGLWIATNIGVRYKVADISYGDEIYYTADNSGLPDNRVSELIEDGNGDVWAGTSQGLARFSFGAWTVVTPITDLPHPLVRSLVMDDKGLWIGTEAGLVLFNKETQKLEPEVYLADKAVTALAVDGVGRLWASTREDGLLVAEQPGQFRQPLDVSEMFQGQIVSLASDIEHLQGIWVGVSYQGISHWNGDMWENFSTAQGLPSNVIYDLSTFPGEAGLWVGSEAGVTRFDGRSWGTFEVKDGELSPSIQAVARNRNGGFWFGGRDGLTSYRPETTPPWVKVVDLSGVNVLEKSTDFADARLEMTGDDLRVDVAAGDLHTDQQNLILLYRWSSPEVDGGWQTTTDRSLTFPIPEPGLYELEVRSRDLAFNYSGFVLSRFELVLPPSTINLPVIGPVSILAFQAGFVLTLVAVLALAYFGNDVWRARGRVREAMVRGYNPYISGEPVRREDMFFGREKLLQRILDTLHSNSIMIHGERRIGKTTLLYQLTSRLRETDDSNFWFVPAYIDLEGTDADDFFHFLMEEIVDAVRTLPGFSAEQKAVLGLLDFTQTSSDDYSDRDFSRDLRNLLEVLEEYGQAVWPGRQLRLILLLDEMDVMSLYPHLIQQQLRRIFMRDFSSSLGAVVAGIQISKAWDRVESPWFNLFNEIELKPFDREQATQLLQTPVEEIYSYEPAALEAIIDYSLGRPFRLQQYGLEAINHMLSENRWRVTLADVEVAHTRIQEQIDRNGDGQPAGSLTEPGLLAAGEIATEATAETVTETPEEIEENSTIDSVVEPVHSIPVDDESDPALGQADPPGKGEMPSDSVQASASAEIEPDETAHSGDSPDTEEGGHSRES